MTLSSLDNQKQHIRRKLRQIRKQIPASVAQDAARTLCLHVTQHQQYQEAAQIACFCSNDFELDTSPLIEQILQHKTICYLPKLKPVAPNRLWFMPYKENTSLKPNQFNIPEVDLPVNYAIRLSKLDIILMPLVAFDNQGNRLGMGGGYYDATLAHLKHSASRPLLYGIAYEEQKINELPVENWDFPLDGIFTQNGFTQFALNSN